MAAGVDVRRDAFAKNADSLSGSGFESFVIVDQRYVVKHVNADSDWLMRALGDGLGGASPWVLRVWESGILEQLPGCIDTAIVGMAYDGSDCAVVMRDVGSTLVPPGADPIPLDQHRRFLDHMAQVHAAMWEFTPAVELLGDFARFGSLGQRVGLTEAERSSRLGVPIDPVPSFIPGGWAAMHDADPQLAEMISQLADNATPLANALAETPATFVHGDWKFGNLGTHDDGRTVLLDWGWPGKTGPCVDLGWYLAVNCDRLPETKEAAITTFHAALESHGVDTCHWWQRQLDLALLGAFTQLGWSKTGDPAEFQWWTRRVTATARELTK